MSNTPFFCHRFSTRTILVLKKEERVSAQHSIKFNIIPNCTNIENLVFLWAVVKVLKSVSEVLLESGAKHILVNTKLMA